MDYVLLENPLPQWAWFLISFFALVIIIACVWAAIIFFVKSAFNDFKNRRKLIGVAFLLVAVLTIGTVTMMARGQYGMNLSNVSVSTENLKTKYSLKDVEWLTSETTARPQNTNTEGVLVVVDEENQRIAFGYKVNMETGEPYLVNLPLRGGSAPGVTAESLEKK